jgi:predicted DNA-binding transcriptional regulator AlpA
MTEDQIADHLVPDPQVEKEFSITSMTLWRWTRDPELGFPPVVKIKSRNYRLRSDLDAFKSRMIAEALRARSDDSATLREAYEARRFRREARRQTAE